MYVHASCDALFYNYSPLLSFTVSSIYVYIYIYLDIAMVMQCQCNRYIYRSCEYTLILN